LKSSKMQGSGEFELQINGQKVKSYPFNEKSKAEAIDFTNDTLDWLHPWFDSFKTNSQINIKLKLNNYKGDWEKFKLSFAIDA